MAETSGGSSSFGSRPEQRPEHRPERVHRVGETQRPTDGPFGPGGKKRREKFSKKPVTGVPERPFSGQAVPGRPFVGKPFVKKQGVGVGGDLRPTRKVPAKGGTDWGAVASWYDELVGDEGSEFHREVVIPGVVKLLGDVGVGGGKKVLDVACGQGVVSRVLAANGAEVWGVDAAEGLIRAARERSAGGGDTIRYQVGDARELAGVPDSAFDAAICVLAIQNIDKPGETFKAVARCLRPGGVFVVVMMHPAFRSPKATHWGWLPDASGGTGGVQFRRVDRYLVPRKEPIVTHPGKAAFGAEGGQEYTWTFHRPIGDYVGFARKAGMMVDAMEEWASHKVSTSGPRAGAENLARQEIPMFLAVRAVKVGS